MEGKEGKVVSGKGGRKREKRGGYREMGVEKGIKKEEGYIEGTKRRERRYEGEGSVKRKRNGWGREGIEGGTVGRVERNGREAGKSAT